MAGLEKKQRAEFYRWQAKEARIQAGKASTEVMRDEYLKLAKEWDRLAGTPLDSASELAPAGAEPLPSSD